MNEEKNSLTNKKIAVRFLKEMGLLNAWKKYLKSDPFYAKNVWPNCEKQTMADDVLGLSTFTMFLQYTYGIKVNSTITYIFRYYLTLLYNEKIKFHTNYDCAYFDVNIDKHGKITRYFLENETKERSL